MGQRLSKKRKSREDYGGWKSQQNLSYDASQIFDQETYEKRLSQSLSTLQRRSQTDINNNSPRKDNNSPSSPPQGPEKNRHSHSANHFRSTKQQQQLTFQINLMQEEEDEDDEQSIWTGVTTERDKKSLFSSLFKQNRTNFGGGGYLYF